MRRVARSLGVIAWIALTSASVTAWSAPKPRSHPAPAATATAADDDSAYTDEHHGWWKRFMIRDISLHAEASKLPGFRCRRESMSSNTGDLDCVQFLDDKLCHGDGSALEEQMKAIGHRVIAVGGCMIDFGEQDKTYLHNNYTELEYVRVVGTATDRPRVYRMYYHFKSTDPLAKDSRLGTALLAKYGQPFEARDGSFRWLIDGVQRPDMSAGCAQGTCMLSLVDDGIRVTEDDLQKEADLAKQKRGAEPPPKF